MPERVALGLKHRLCGGAEQPTHTKQFGELLHDLCNWGVKVARQLLRLIQNDDAVSEVVQFSTTAWPCGMERFEQLHIGGDDDRRIPVFTCQPGAGIITVIKITVVLNNRLFPKRLTEHGGVLLDNAGVGNSVNNAFFAVTQGVVERKAEACQRFTAAGRHRQAKQAGRKRRCLPGFVKDGLAQRMQR